MGDTDAVRGMDSPVLEKVEDPQHGDHSSGSIATTPDAEGHEPEQPQAHDTSQQPQKRKGGRKPIYATSEERKQRNRQAQAAFRERRTEYIKQLESTIKVHEENLQNLQQSHRTAADECLMLRYKNSLLERILLEKGIDVQAELRAKGGSPNLGPTRMPAPLSQPIQRFAVNKYAQNRRSLNGLQPKADGISPTQPVHISPNLQPLVASRISSPTIAAHQRSPNFIPQTGPMSPSFGPTSQQMRPQHAIRPQLNSGPNRPAMPSANHPSSASTIGSAMSLGSSNAPNASAGHNPSQNTFYAPSFQNHYDQLEQEYDEDNDMYDDESSHPSAGAGAYPTAFQVPAPGVPRQPPPTQPPPQMTPNGMHPMQPPQQAPAHPADANGQFAVGQAYETYDPMLEADPFGLSASMHFPTQFSTFDASMR